MKQWYRKTAAKAALAVLAVLSSACCVTGFFSAMSLAGTVNPAVIWETTNQPYEETQIFNVAVENMVEEIMRKIRLENMFETDGSYNQNKLTDIMEYSRDGTINGINVSGIAYTLEQLENWSEDFQRSEGDFYEDNKVVVCEKTDGTYYYYYMNDFLILFERGDLAMQFGEDSEFLQNAFLSELEEGNMTSSQGYDFWITDGDGKIQYTDCWNFGRSIREKYAPDGAESLLEVVNSRPELNGKLTVIYDNLALVLGGLYYDIQAYQNGWDYLEEGNTNLTYIYVNEDTKKVDANKSGYDEYEKVWQNIEAMKSEETMRYMVVHPQLKDFDTNMKISASGEWDQIRSYTDDRVFNKTLAVGIDTTYPIQDQFYEGHESYEKDTPVLRCALILAYVSGVLFLAALIYLALAAGRRVGDDGIHLTVFDHWKTEVSAGIVILGCYLGIYFLIHSELLSFLVRDEIILFVCAAFMCCCFLVGYISLIRRIKAKTVWKNSLMRTFYYLLRDVIRERSIPAKAVMLLLTFMAVEWMTVMTRSLIAVFALLVMDIVVVYVILSHAVAKNRLKTGIEEIASGNMSYQIPLKGLRGSNRRLAEKVNDIGEGLNRAVAEGMKNERLKTDLITNVSHDIKTPLTSIINYVDILKRSGIDDPKIRGYLDILESKAQRLKTLTEDVVEASKVSSGNIVLECMDMNLVELVQQTEGEFAEKFEARNLSMVVNLPEEPAVVHVDGRRMWRVLENIFGNAAKYAMPGTRVYADLTVSGDYVNFSLKNVSEQQLNISADELTERFIRGDISRSTEGSGLGLSIARSLTEMQGGTFDLYLDGDLFRVNICFKRVR